MLPLFYYVHVSSEGKMIFFVYFLLERFPFPTVMSLMSMVCFGPEEVVRLLFPQSAPMPSLGFIVKGRSLLRT